jgi:hypothetical protein
MAGLRKLGFEPCVYPSFAPSYNAAGIRKVMWWWEGASLHHPEYLATADACFLDDLWQPKGA